MFLDSPVQAKDKNLFFLMFSRRGFRDIGQ